MLGLLATISVGSVHAQSAPVGPDGWRRDLEFVVAGIKAVHPRPFHRVLEASFDSAAAAVRVALPRMSGEEAMVALMGLVALVHDGHTRLASRAIMAPDNRWFPVRIDRFADGIFVVATDSAHRALLGAEVLRLGDRRAADAWAAGRAGVGRGQSLLEDGRGAAAADDARSGDGSRARDPGWASSGGPTRRHGTGRDDPVDHRASRSGRAARSGGAWRAEHRPSDRRNASAGIPEA